MAIDVSEDLDQAGGYAFIDLGRHSDRPFEKISIRRLDAEPRHLGVEDWQPEVAWLEPRSIERRALSTVIRIGPEIVDRIEELVQIEIVAEGDHSLGVVTWPAITPSPGIDGSLSLQGTGKPTPSLVAEGEAPSAESRPAEQEPSEPIVAARPPAVLDNAVQPTAVAPPRRAPLWAAAAIVLVGAAGAAFWFVQQTPHPRPRPEPETPRSPVSAGELTQKLEALLQRAAPPAALMGIGSEALAAGQPAVAFRAFEAADPYANPDAALQLARIYDPRISDDGRRAAAPNAPRAISYYALWKNRSAAHTTELKALCSASASLVAGNDRLAAACRD